MPDHQNLWLSVPAQATTSTRLFLVSQYIMTWANHSNSKPTTRLICCWKRCFIAALFTAVRWWNTYVYLRYHPSIESGNQIEDAKSRLYYPLPASARIDSFELRAGETQGELSHRVNTCWWKFASQRSSLPSTEFFQSLLFSACT